MFWIELPIYVRVILIVGGIFIVLGSTALYCQKNALVEAVEKGNTTEVRPLLEGKQMQKLMKKRLFRPGPLNGAILKSRGLDLPSRTGSKK